MSKWVCRGRKVVETVGRWVVWTRKEGTWKGELVGSGGRRGGRTSDVASHTVPISRAQIAWQGREGKGRFKGGYFGPAILRTTQQVLFTLCCTLQAARSQPSIIALQLFCGHWAAGSIEVRREPSTRGLFLFSPGSTLCTGCYDSYLFLADSVPR
jgi:hypothetical protein